MLSVRSLSVSYGRARAVSDVSFPVGDRELVVMVGRNGAGKTTILSAIVGLLKPAAGSIWLGESRPDGLAAHRTYSAGVVLVPQGRGIFKDLSVRDNLLLGSFPRVISRRRAEVKE